MCARARVCVCVEETHNQDTTSDKQPTGYAKAVPVYARQGGCVSCRVSVISPDPGRLWPVGLARRTDPPRRVVVRPPGGGELGVASPPISRVPPFSRHAYRVSLLGN